MDAAAVQLGSGATSEAATAVAEPALIATTSTASADPLQPEARHTALSEPSTAAPLDGGASARELEPTPLAPVPDAAVAEAAAAVAMEPATASTVANVHGSDESSADAPQPGTLLYYC